MTITTVATREKTNWWHEPVRLNKEARRSHEPGGRAVFRLGDVRLEIDSTYRPLLEALKDAYGDCAIEIAEDQNGDRVVCSARVIGKLVALEFEVPVTIPP